MTGLSNQTHLEQELDALLAGKEFSNLKLRILLVEMILHYLEGDVSLTFILTSGAAIHHRIASKLAPDLLEATSTLSYLAEHVNTKKPYSFVEHQKIEDTLATIMQQLQQATSVK